MSLEMSTRDSIKRALGECREASDCHVMSRGDDAYHHIQEATRILHALLLADSRVAAK